MDRCIILLFLFVFVIFTCQGKSKFKSRDTIPFRVRKWPFKSRNYTIMSPAMMNKYTLMNKCSDTGPRCKKNCFGLSDGDYQSCRGCNIYITCSNNMIYNNRKCAPGNLEWDDISKSCDYKSRTCSCNGKCSSTMFCGRMVLRNSTMGVNNIEVLNADTGAYITTTDYLGHFSISRNTVFASNIIKVKSRYYHLANNSIVVKPNMYVEVVVMTTPVFTIEPIDTKAIIGSSVTLKCEAESTPSPYKFVWYKNDKEFKVFDSKTMHDITFSSDLVSTDIYHCVAFGQFNVISSSKAEIKFQVKKHPCSDVLTNWVKLPGTYKLKNNGRKEIDVGYCGTIGPCLPKSEEISTGYCCQAGEVDTITAVNDVGIILPINKIISCACLPCEVVPRYLVKGRLQDIANGDADFSGTFILNNGVEYEVTNSKFEFLAVASAGNIVFEVRSKFYMPNLVSLDTANPEIEIEYKDYKKSQRVINTIATMVKKPFGEIFNAKSGIVFKVDAPKHLPSAVTVSILPNSIVNSKGELYIGQVKILTHMADIRGGTHSLDSVPGSFRTLQSDGFYKSLRTNGVMTIIVETIHGHRLTIAKPYVIDINIDAMSINSNPQNEKVTSIYGIDQKTGSWNFVEALPVKLLYKKRKRRELTTISFLVLKSDDSYFSLQTIWDVCYVSVDLTHTWQGVEYPCISKNMKAVTMDTNNSVLVATHSSDTNGRTCLTMLCDNIFYVSMVMPILFQENYVPNANNIPPAAAYDYQLINDHAPRILLLTRKGSMTAVSNTVSECMSKPYSYGFTHEGLPVYT